MLEKFLKTIKEEKLIKKHDKIVIGVSGGADSISLLHLFFTIKEMYNLKIYVVHLNHMFRGVDADEDAKYVRDFCEKLSIPCYIFKKQVQEYSKNKGMTFEEGGRELRYKYFYEVAKKHGATKIAIAQNLDDQAETMLMRFMRGSGVEGLCAMDYKRKMIVRPLLNVRRRDIEKYCTINKLNPRRDHTNKESIYTRNKIRLELLPYIAQNFNENIKETLFRTWELLKEDKNFLQECVEDSYYKVVKEKNCNIHICRDEFEKTHRAINRRILRKAIEFICGDMKNIEKKHIEKMSEFIRTSKSGTSIDLPKNLIMVCQYNEIVLKEKKSNLIENFDYKLKINEKNYIKELDAQIYPQIIEKNEYNRDSKGKYNMYFDFDEAYDIYIRNRRNGDRFKPYGINGKKKLKDFFIDEKIPKEERNLIPLIVSDDHILWVVGHRRSSLKRVNNHTSKILKISYIL